MMTRKDKVLLGGTLVSALALLFPQAVLAQEAAGV